jgi:drug/metabolite transporter, DME family
MTTERLAGRGWGLLMVVLATVCWSTSGFLINVVVDSTAISSAALAFWRDLTVAMVLFIALAALQPRALRVQRRDLPWLAAMGALGIGLFHYCWNSSVLSNGASLSTIIQSNGPILVAVGAWLLLREPLTWRKGLAILLTLSGTVLVVGTNGWAQLDLEGAELLAAAGVPVFYAAFSIFGKKVAGSYDPWTILTYVFAFGTLALFPLQWGSPIPWPVSLHALAGFVGLILVTTILGYGLYTAGLRRLQASVASIVATSEVLFASIFGYFLLGERLDGFQIVGAVLIVSGVVLLSYRRNRPAV